MKKILLIILLLTMGGALAIVSVSMAMAQNYSAILPAPQTRAAVSPNPQTHVTVPPVLKTNTPLPTNIPANLQVNGSHIVNSQGKSVFLKGVDISAEYLCSPTRMFSLQQLQNAQTWNINAVKLTINPQFWLEGRNAQGCSSSQYQSDIAAAITHARHMGLYVIAAAYEWSGSPQAGLKMATKLTQQFWQSFAPLYAGDTGVLYETFNEPQNITPEQWLNGDTGKGYVGEQQLADTIRQTGANNIILIDGPTWSGKIGLLLPQYALKGSNIAYAAHIWSNGSNRNPANWAANWENAAAKYPIVITEFGDNSPHCSYTSWLQQVMPVIAQNTDGMFAWAFNSDGAMCGRPNLISKSGAVSAYGLPIYQFFKNMSGN